jgi:hypothetical protein
VRAHAALNRFAAAQGPEGGAVVEARGAELVPVDRDLVPVAPAPPQKPRAPHVEALPGRFGGLEAGSRTSGSSPAARNRVRANRRWVSMARRSASTTPRSARGGPPGSNRSTAGCVGSSADRPATRSCSSATRKTRSCGGASRTSDRPPSAGAASRPLNVREQEGDGAGRRRRFRLPLGVRLCELLESQRGILARNLELLVSIKRPARSESATGRMTTAGCSFPSCLSPSSG